MNLSNIIRPEHTFIGLSVTTRWRALQAIAEKAGNAFGIDGQTVLKALESREKLGSTGIGNGIAVPHAAINGSDEPAWPADPFRRSRWISMRSTISRRTSPSCCSSGK